MSVRALLAGVASVVAFGVASMIGVWLLTPERPAREGRVEPAAPGVPSPPPPAAPIRPAQPAPVASAPRPEPAPPQAARAPAATLKPAPSAPRPRVRLTPLFAPNSRLELGRIAALEFRAEHEGSGAPAAREKISVSALRVGERIEEPLPVRELAGGVYRAEFVPRAPGQFVLAAASRGLLATTVSVIVPEAAGSGGGEAPSAMPAQRARAEAGRGRR
jgi:hypothetical protein